MASSDEQQDLVMILMPHLCQSSFKLTRDNELFRKIASDENHILHKIFPDKRNRALREHEIEHEFIPPRVKTERFKRANS